MKNICTKKLEERFFDNLVAKELVAFLKGGGGKRDTVVRPAQVMERVGDAGEVLAGDDFGNGGVVKGPTDG